MRRVGVAAADQAARNARSRGGHTCGVAHAAFGSSAGVTLRIVDSQVGSDDARPTVLELDERLDVLDVASCVQRVDQHRVLLGDEAATHLARARQLVVVGIELLVQDQEPLHLRIGETGLAGELGIHLLDAAADQLVHGGLRRKIGVAGVGNAAPLGPVADRADVDVDERAHAVAVGAEHDRFLDVREELELVLDVVRREHRAGRELADVLRAIDDLQLTARVDEAGVAGVEVAVGVDRLGGRIGPLVVLLQQHRPAHQHLARVGDLELDAGRRLADGVEMDAAVRLQAHVRACLGRAVELLQVDADRTVEAEQVRPDRSARRVGDANARHAEHVAQWRVDEHVADRVLNAVGQRHRFLPSRISAPQRRATAVKCSNNARLMRPASSIRIITCVSRFSNTRGGAK